MDSLPQLLLDQSLAVDVCIVGAGPAGIAIAREFAGTGVRVCLVESGGSAASPAKQALARGATFGDPIHAPEEVCTRAFGGNSRAWHVQLGDGRLGVRYVPMDEVDFEKRSWMPFSGWPFGRAHLDPFYERAQGVCRSGPFAYGPEPWEGERAKRPALGNGDLETAMFQFGAADVFHGRYRKELAEAANVRLLLNTSVVEIEANPRGDAAARVLCVDDRGKRLAVRAKAFVLAAGGFENARLLLMSDKRHPGGIGNRHDVVGRYFHDHPLVFGGVFTPTARSLFNDMGLFDLRRVNGFPVMGHLKLSGEASRRNRLLNMSACLFPRPGENKAQAILAFQRAVRDLKAKRWPKDAASSLRRVVRHADAVAQASVLSLRAKRLICSFDKGGWSELEGNDKRFASFHVFHQVEQAPDPSNRVVLGRGRDALGCPTLEVHWRWSGEDAARVARAQDLMASELLRADLGEFRVAEKDGAPDILRPSGTHHIMGTTRMHDDPRLGVVDADCRVHGMANLFVAGSSVFPTGGYANPTLTVVALALRLADHLKARLGRTAEAVDSDVFAPAG